MLEALNQPYLILFSSIAITGCIRLFSNLYSKNHTKNMADTALYILFSALVPMGVVLIFILVDGFQGVSWFTFGLSLVFAVCTFVNTYAATRALVTGPLAYTCIIASASSIVPILYSCIFLGEKITVWQIAGIALLLLCVFLSVDQQPDKKKASLKWLAYALTNFLMNGLVGVLQKVHRTSAHAAETNEYLLLMFFFTTVFTVIYILVLKKKGTVSSAKPLKNPKVFWILFGAALSVGLVNILNLYLSGVFDAGMIFPVLNGGGTLLSLILSLVVFRERFTVRRWIGLAVGVLSLLFLFGIVEILLRQLGFAL